MSTQHLYSMTISLNVLKHLGIGLYSSIPAVLSEVVANAWDADATCVSIDVHTKVDNSSSGNQSIIIQDNGIGMTQQDINEKYLTIGYNKRHMEPGKTPKGRLPMGRKGIGKLSLFSIADTIEIYSVRNGEKNALTMNREDIESKIHGNESGDYHPDPLDFQSVDFEKGTKIILRNLRKKIDTSENALRKRLARRFSIIGTAHSFEVYINGESITAKDRDYYNNLEFIWALGEESEYISNLCPNKREYKVVQNDIHLPEGSVKVYGWIATIDEQKHIDAENNTIVIFSHGKLIHEDILKDLKEGGVYSKYIIGEIDADFMDVDNKEDIVTSARQSVKEDDPRYIAIKDYTQNILKQIQSEWTKLRKKIGTEKALTIPTVKEWFGELTPDNKKSAEKLFGKIESLPLPDSRIKKEIYKSSIIAFQTLALKDNLSLLDELGSGDDLLVLVKLFESIDELEIVHYYQIIKGRIEVIKEFTKILPDSREKVLQKYIFDHLWLLDPSWERASSNMRIEESVTKEFTKVSSKLTEEERSGRIDIRYRTAAGKHIIIELKKYDRSVTVFELAEQVQKYRAALEKCLEDKFPNEPRIIESICIIGSAPTGGNRQMIEDTLRAVNARFITYDTLVQQTLQSYQEFVSAETATNKLISILDNLDKSFEQDDIIVKVQVPQAPPQTLTQLLLLDPI